MELTKDELIRRADRLKAFLADDVVAQAFENLKTRWYEEWKSSATPEARERLWAKSCALDELEGAFRAIVDGGVVASAEAGDPPTP